MKKYTLSPGMIFGRLTTIEKDPAKKCHWFCSCECGVIKSYRIYYLIDGRTKSCGCYNIDNLIIRNTSHGMSKTSEYSIWCTIKDRCLNQNNHKFKSYGGRGITIHPEWADSFEAFYEHIGPRPDSTYSVDRIDNSLGYIPGNVRWATDLQQANNARTNHLIEFNGVTQTLAEWARETGLSYGALQSRIQRGYDLEEALTAPSGIKWKNVMRPLEFNGVVMSMSYWSKQTKIPFTTIRNRIDKMGWSVEDALTKPSGSGYGRNIEFNGITQNLNAWERTTGITAGAIKTRLKRGWPIEKALTTPVKPPKT
jgi:hypothetical protein